jgi:hypothetical protein
VERTAPTRDANRVALRALDDLHQGGHVGGAALVQLARRVQGARARLAVVLA